MIGLGVEACDFRCSLEPQITGFTPYFEGRKQHGDDVLVYTPLQELVLAVYFLFRDGFTLVMIATFSEVNLQLWAKLQRDRDLVFKRFDDIYNTSELACLISNFDCMSDGKMKGYVFCPFRDGILDSSAARIIKQLCFTLCSTDVDMSILSIVDPKKLVFRFGGLVYKVFVSLLSFSFFSTFFIRLLPSGDVLCCMRAGNRL